MKFLGLTLKSGNNDVWHSGNLTKLSDLLNDLPPGGTKVTTSVTEPSSKAAGDFWYKEV